MRSVATGILGAMQPAIQPITITEKKSFDKRVFFGEGGGHGKALLPEMISGNRA